MHHYASNMKKLPINSMCPRCAILGHRRSLEAVQSCRFACGFTLIELLITLSIAVILLTVAIPSFQSFILQGRLTGHTNDLVLAMASAKSEAVKRGANVTVCASSNLSTCTGAWQAGWIVVSSSGQVLQAHPAYSGTMCGSDTSIVFRGSGFPVAGLTLDLYDSRGVASGRNIVVSAQGRTTTTTGASACP